MITSTKGGPVEEHTLSYQYFDKHGKLVMSEKESVCKIVTSTFSKKNSYFIKKCSGYLYDVQNINPQYNNKLWKFTRVSYEVFSEYLRYLTTTRKVHLTRAERIYG